VFSSNIEAGARIAVALEPELVVFDGSGAALPPMATDRRLLVVGGSQAPAVAAGYLNTYRILRADLVLVTFAEDGTPWRSMVEAVRGVARRGVEILPTVLRPRPLADVSGRSVAYFCTAPEPAHITLVRHLEQAHGARVVHVSGNLGDRDALRHELSRVDADVFLVELKAAAIDVVAEHAVARGGEVVLAANDVVSRSPDGRLDETLLEMAGIAG
jgi:cyclic 2,3-diphosphoglycerate synthetase